MVSEEKIYSLDELGSLIESKFQDMELPSEPKLLYDPIRYIISSGGKRIRPVLVLAATNIYTSEIDRAIYAALAVEVFHNFTLVHDDIMDNATQRRGRDTVHTKWNNSVAILSGDAMSILSYTLLSNTNPSYLHKVIQVFNKFSMEICEGQQMDMDFEDRVEVSVEEYLKMIELKTSVLIKGALQIGGIIGGASDSDCELLGDFGLNLGLAFQLQDDLLDLYGDQKSFGKKIGGDIIAKKKTILYLNALSESQDKNGLIDYYNDPKVPADNKIKTLIELYNKLKIKSKTESQISNFFLNATNNLKSLDIPDHRKITLFQLANKLMNRDK